MQILIIKAWSRKTFVCFSKKAHFVHRTSLHMIMVSLDRFPLYDI